MIGLVVSKPITDYSINRFMLSKYTISVEKGGIRGWVGLGRVGGKGGLGLNVWGGGYYPQGERTAPIFYPPPKII